MPFEKSEKGQVGCRQKWTKGMIDVVYLSAKT